MLLRILGWVGGLLMGVTGVIATDWHAVVLASALLISSALWRQEGEE